LLIGLAYAAISATPSARFAELAPAFRIRVSSGLRGPDLQHQIVEFQPKIKVLFMSGYAEGLPDLKLPQGADFCKNVSLFRAARKSASTPNRRLILTVRSPRPGHRCFDVLPHH
jgi:hypothetical protein